MFNSIGAFIAKYVLDYIRVEGIKAVVAWVKELFFSKKVNKEVKDVTNITDEIYELETKIEAIEKMPDLPLNKMKIEDHNKRIKVLENELRKASIDLTGGMGSE